LKSGESVGQHSDRRCAARRGGQIRAAVRVDRRPRELSRVESLPLARLRGAAVL
jgi:hypothetical protein